MFDKLAGCMLGACRLQNIFFGQTELLLQGQSVKGAQEVGRKQSSSSDPDPYPLLQNLNLKGFLKNILFFSDHETEAQEA